MQRNRGKRRKCTGSDATNSSVWQNSKIMSTHIESCYIFAAGADADPEIRKRGLFADLQRVEGATAEHTMSLLDKQLQSLGVPLVWKTEGTAMPKTTDLGQRQHRILRFYLYTSDGGPDQVKYRKMMRGIFHSNDYLTCFFIDNSCQMHAPHLGVRMGLRVLDAWCQR